MKAIETKRLLLVPLSEDDAPFIIELLNSPNWLRFLGDRNIRTIEQAKHYLLNGPMKSYSEHGFGTFKVQLKTNGTPIGICGLIKREGLDDVDIGYALLPAYEKYGYAIEAAEATIDFARSIGLTRIVAIVNNNNAASIKLLEKIGLTFEKHVTLPSNTEALMLFGMSLINERITI